MSEQLKNSLEEKLNYLEQEYDRLKTENENLNSQILEYQYRIGEKRRPLPRIRLENYLSGLKGNDKKKFLTRDYVITGAVLQPISIKRSGIQDVFCLDMIAPLLCLNSDQYLTTDFRIPIGFFRNPSYESKLRQILEPRIAVKGHEFIVQSYKKGNISDSLYMFIVGYIDEQGKERHF